MDLEFGKFEPRHFRTFKLNYANKKSILARKSHGSCFYDISTHTTIGQPRLQGVGVYLILHVLAVHAVCHNQCVVWKAMSALRSACASL